MCLIKTAIGSAPQAVTKNSEVERSPGTGNLSWVCHVSCLLQWISVQGAPSSREMQPTMDVNSESRLSIILHEYFSMAVRNLHKTVYNDPFFSNYPHPLA